MALNLTKLIPSNLRVVQRFVDLISAFQSYLYGVVKVNINNFKNRSDINIVTQADAENMIWDKGFNLSKGDGYTSTLRYTKRELLTLVKRILTKSSHKSYQYIFYIFDLMGETSPCIFNVDGTLTPRLTWLTSSDVNNMSLQLDTSLTLDMPYAQFAFWTLDYGDFVNFTTRHINISYSPRFVENSEDQMSIGTCAAFFNDVAQNKRLVEIPHYEFRLYADASLFGNDTIEVWTDYDNTFTVNQHSIYLQHMDIYAYNSTMSEAYSVQFGNGIHNVIDQSITGCASPTTAILPLSDFIIAQQDATHLYFRHKMFPYEKFGDIREAIIYDSIGNAIFYTTFPWIHFDPRMLSHGFFFFTLN